MLLFPPADFLGKHVGDLVPAHHRDALLAKHYDVWETKQPGRFEYSDMKDGKLKWMESRIYLEQTETRTGVEESFVAIVRDITVQKNLEFEITRVSNMLQSIVGSRLLHLCFSHLLMQETKACSF